MQARSFKNEMNRGNRLQVMLVAGSVLFSLWLAGCKPKATLAPLSAPVAPPAGVSISFDAALAQEARQLYTSRYTCNVCHNISSLGMSGGSLGPDLSGVLLGRVSQDTAPPLHPLKQWFAERALAHPEQDPAKAGEVLAAFFASPPDYAPTKRAQVTTFMATAGGEEPWLRDVNALVELLKEAAAKRYPQR